MTDDWPLGLTPGDEIGYHPNGDEDIRWAGVVRRFDGVTFTVSMPDDPGIEERVRPEDIRAVGYA